MNLSVDVYHLQPFDGTTRSGVGRKHHARTERLEGRVRNLHVSAPAPAMAVHGSRTAQRPAGNVFDAEVDTHWTRILHHDFLNAEAGSGRTRSPLLSGAILLGIFVAMYLAVAAVVHVLDLPDPTGTVAPAGPAVPAATAVAFARHVDEGAPRQRGVIG